MIKKNFAKNTAYPNYRDAVQARLTMIANVIATGLAKVTGVYLSIHKNMELHYKFRKFMPKEYILSVWGQLNFYAWVGD